jgi:hypothetical protein
VEPDDLILPDPSDPTDETPRQSRSLVRAVLDAWPFDAVDTILLGLLYVAPFVIRWLVSP